MSTIPPPTVVDAPAPAPRPSALRAVRLVLGTAVLIQVINSVSGVELARWLGVHRRGELAAAMLWPIVAGTLGLLGLEESLTYHVAREPRRAEELTGSGLLLAVTQAIIFGALTFAAVPLVLHARGHTVLVAAWIFCLYVPLFLISVSLNSVLNGLHRYSWFNAVLLAVVLLSLALQTLLLIVGVRSIALIAATTLGAQAVTIALIVALLWRAGLRRLQITRRAVRQLFSFGVRSHASTVPSTLNYSVDQLVISVLLSASQLAIYVVAVTMTSLTALVGASVARALLPNVAAAPTLAAQREVAQRFTSLTWICATAVSLPLLIVVPWVIRLLFGAGFASGADVARILLVASIALATNRALEAVLRGVGSPLDAGVAEFVSLGVTAIGLAVLLPPLGLTGAALASLAAYATSSAFMLARLRRALDTGLLTLLLPSRTDVRSASAWASAHARRTSGRRGPSTP